MPFLLDGVAIDRSLILQSEPSKRTEIAATESVKRMKAISVESKRASIPSQVGVFLGQSSPKPAAETGNNEAKAEPAADIGANVAKAMPAGSSATRLSGDRTFTLFWAGQTFDAIGDAAASIIMPLVLETTGSITQMGLVTAAFGVGAFLSGVTSGNIVDSADRRRLLIRPRFFCSALWTLVAAAGPIGGALATSLVQHTGVVFVLVLMGVVGFFIAITGFLTAAYTRLPDEAALPNPVRDPAGADIKGARRS